MKEPQRRRVMHRDVAQPGRFAQWAWLVSALGAGHAVAQPSPTPSVQIYGVISVGPAIVSNVGGASQTRLQSSLNVANYFGFRGTEDLGGGMTAAFALATNINVPLGTAGQGPAFWNKNSWVGLGSRELGSIAIGRNDEFANEQCYTGPLCWSGLIFNLHPGNLDHIGGGQLAKMIKYTSPTFNKLRVRAFYSLGDAAAGTNTGRAVGVEGIYRGDALAVTGTFVSIKGSSIAPASASIGIGLKRFFGNVATPATSFLLDKQDIYVLGARYTIDKFIVYGLGTDVVLTYKAQKDSMKTYEAGLTYSPDPLLALTGACFHSTFAASTWNTCGLNATYFLSKRTSVFLADSYQRTGGPFQTAQMFQASGASTNNKQNALAVGVRHAF